MASTVSNNQLRKDIRKLASKWSERLFGGGLGDWSCRREAFVHYYRRPGKENQRVDPSDNTFRLPPFQRGFRYNGR